MKIQYKKGEYDGKTIEEIKKHIQKEGFAPIPIHNSPGYEYRPHEHPETKLLVILSGSMSVSAEGKKYQLHPYDGIVITGNISHSAKVGKKGCRFLWSERLTSRAQ